MADLIPDTAYRIIWFHEVQDMSVDGDIGTLFAETETIPRFRDFAIISDSGSERISDFLRSVAAAIRVDADFDLVFHRKELRIEGSGFPEK